MSLGRWFLRLPWSAARPDCDRDDCDDHGDDPGEQEGIAQETSKESGGADRDVAPEVPISVEPRSVDERAGLGSNREVVLEVAPERAGIGVALVRVDDRVVVVVDEPVVVASIHNWFIDYNDNSVVDANESYSDSGTFRGTLQYNFTVGNQTGTFVYRSRFNGDGNLWGNITVRPAGFLGGLLGNPLLIAGISAVIVAVVAVAIWARRRPRQPEEPPAE